MRDKREIARFLSQGGDGSTIDIHKGSNTPLWVERAGETDLIIGDGYADMPIREFSAAVKAGTFYGKYPIPPAEYVDNRYRQMRTMPDLRWSKKRV